MQKDIIYANTGQLEKIADLLKGFPNTAVKVMNRVLVRAEGSVRTETARMIPKVFGTNQTEIRNALKGRKVRTIIGKAGVGSISVEVRGRPLTVIRFRHTPSTTAEPKSPKDAGKKKRRRRKIQPKVMIYRGKGMIPLGPVPGSDGKLKPVFVASTNAKSSESIQRIFFYHTGKKINGKDGEREEMKAARTLSIPQMATNPEVAEPMTEKLNSIIEKRLTHELDYAFNGLGTNLKGSE